MPKMLNLTKKQKGPMHMHGALYLVPLTGIELATFALRMRSSLYIEASNDIVTTNKNPYISVAYSIFSPPLC